MHVTWLGGTTVKIQAKHNGEDVTVVIDPYKYSKGSSPRSLAPNIALFTHGEENAITLSGSPFILSSPGECETKGVLITAAGGTTPDEVVFRIDVEDMSLGAIGRTQKALSPEALEVLNGVDILCVPVGAKDTYDSEAAIKIVNSLEPRVVIPTAFKSDNDPDADPVTSFAKALGATASPEPKVIFKKKELPEEETRVVILEKE